MVDLSEMPSHKDIVFLDLLDNGMISSDKILRKVFLRTILLLGPLLRHFLLHLDLLGLLRWLVALLLTGPMLQSELVDLIPNEEVLREILVQVGEDVLPLHLDGGLDHIRHAVRG